MLLCLCTIVHLPIIQYEQTEVENKAAVFVVFQFYDILSHLLWHVYFKNKLNYVMWKMVSNSQYVISLVNDS